MRMVLMMMVLQNNSNDNEDGVEDDGIDIID